MKEIELRLALVFYGGVSLAIYMHGVSREVLNLVRASAFRVDSAAFTDARSGSPGELSPTQKAYKKLMDLLSGQAQIRVVADAIAGASAGGVNGIMLARALAHDLPLDSHTNLWLKNADVTRLSSAQNGLSRYFKMSVSPVLDRLMSAQLARQIESEETREKLRQFMQARWFTPPFSGERFIGWMLDACKQMEAEARPGRTLIPRGQTLDLFVTLTDYNGIKRKILLDDPEFIEEWDHRRILNFHAAHRTPGFIDSQFGSDCIPELVFAARSTSSFPGAFPPATVSEMDNILAERGERWPHRNAFLARGLGLNEDAGLKHSFVDGSVVMNKPFAPVIDIIKQRPAAREVARRLIYVDPVPSDGARTQDTGGDLPGFFRVIFASLAHIPRNEPIGDDLKEIESNNRRSRWLSQLIDAAGPMVEQAVEGILPKWRTITTDIVAKCRRTATANAFQQAGYAFVNYQSLKLHALAERLAELISRLGETDGVPRREDALLSLLSARFLQITRDSADQLGRSDPTVVALLRGLDVDYRIRRLRFAIRRLNSYYRHDPASGLLPPNPDALDAVKGLLYEQIDHLLWRWTDTFYGAVSREAAASLCRGRRSDGTLDPDKLVEYLESLTQIMGLADLDRLQDELFAEKAQALLDPGRHQALLRNYIGFAYYDLITFPVLQRNDFSEVTEILVDRISPRDAATLYREGFDLKGRELNYFGAFFNRSWREHDYLWGRLNAADRLVSILLSAAGPVELAPAEVRIARAEVFQAILEEERGRLQAIPEEFQRVSTLIREYCSVEPEHEPADRRT